MIRTPMILAVLVIATGLHAQDTLQMNRWTGGTALNLPKHRWELGVLSASGVGLTKNVELSLHPLSFFVLPQAKVKAGWGEYSGFTLATEHGLMSPTLFMQLVSAKGTGGLISPEFTIPFMFSVTNRFLASFRPFAGALLTARAGITFAIRTGPLDRRTTIDLPVIYPRLAVFYDQPEFDLGVDFRGRFSPLFGWLFSVENFVVCGTEENYFMENKGMGCYTSNRGTLRIEAGYKLCFGKYPSGPQWHLLPALDFVFGSRDRR